MKICYQFKFVSYFFREFNKEKETKIITRHRLSSFIQQCKPSSLIKNFGYHVSPIKSYTCSIQNFRIDIKLEIICTNAQKGFSEKAK